MITKALGRAGRAVIPGPHFRLSVVAEPEGPMCFHLVDHRTGCVVYHGPIDGRAMVVVEAYLATAERKGGAV